MSASYQELKDHTISYFKGKVLEADLTKPIKDLPIDSLDLFEYVMALEEKFKIEIKTDTVETTITLDQFFRMLTEDQRSALSSI